MAITTHKVDTANDYNGRDMASLAGTRYQGSAATIKARIDTLVKFLIGKYNALIDDLSSTAEGKGISLLGMEAIAGLDATDPQGALEELATLIAVVDNLTDGGSTVPLSAEQGKNLKTYLDNGWIPVAGTWEYASATTITVPSGAASLYTVGDKFKLTANSVVLQGYIVGVADTLLTVVGDALTNHAFSGVFISKIINPQGFKHWFNWTPTMTGGSVDIPSFSTARFKITGREVRVIFKAGAVTTTGSAGTARITLPITALNTPINFWGQYLYFNGTSYAYARCYLESTYMELWGDLSGGNLSTGSNRFFFIEGVYEI